MERYWVGLPFIHWCISEIAENSELDDKFEIFDISKTVEKSEILRN